MWGKVIAVVVGAGFGASCDLHSEEPLRTATYPVNYVALADCTYLRIENKGTVRKEDFPTQNTSRLTYGTGEADMARLDFIGIGATQTKVDMRFPVAIQGRDTWPNKYHPDIDACAASPAVVAYSSSGSVGGAQ